MSPPPENRAATVAIIDDMLPNALLLKNYMKQIEGIQCLVFTDPREALAQWGEDAPDLVLLSPDVAAYFRDEQSVNQALRALIDAAKGSRRRGR